jgi:hypothetical protein
VDGTPPAVAMTSGQQITPNQPVSFAVADSESGVYSISLSVDGQDVADYGGTDADEGFGPPVPANGRFSYSSVGPWGYGTHDWRITAVGNVGNQANVSGTFFVGLSPPSGGSSGGGKPSSGVKGGRGKVTLKGRVGRLQLDSSTQADVIAFAGQPDAAATGSFITGSPRYANFFAMGYFCQGSERVSTSPVGNSDYCSTVFYINRKTKRLTAFYTSSRRYSIDGAFPGMSSGQAQRRIQQIPISGCQQGFGLGSRTTHASLLAAVVGGRASLRRVDGRTLDELFGGRLVSLSLESNGHPVGLLFC